MYDRFVTLVKMAILSVAWQMNMWMLKNGSQKTAVNFWEISKGQFQGIGRWLGIALFFSGKVVRGLLLSIFGISSIINVLMNMRVDGKEKEYK